MLPHPFTIPSWAPEGYRLYKDNVYIAGAQSEEFPYLILNLNWRKSTTDHITFIVMYPLGEDDPGWYVPTGVVEEVTVNGQPAAVVRGTWFEENGEYSVLTSPPILIWKRDGITYRLLANNRKVSLEDLIRMAESAP